MGGRRALGWLVTAPRARTPPQNRRGPIQTIWSRSGAGVQARLYAVGRGLRPARLPVARTVLLRGYDNRRNRKSEGYARAVRTACRAHPAHAAGGGEL